MGSDGRTNPRRAAREARAETEEHSRLYGNLLHALEDWKTFHDMSNEEMQDWCVSVFKSYWTRKANQEAEYESRVYLDCPFREKDECKKLGGKWDAHKGQWYVSGGKDIEPFKKWITTEENENAL